MKFKKICIIAFACVSLLTGCQETPEDDYTKEFKQVSDDGYYTIDESYIGTQWAIYNKLETSHDDHKHYSFEIVDELGNTIGMSVEEEAYNLFGNGDVIEFTENGFKFVTTLEAEDITDEVIQKDITDEVIQKDIDTEKSLDTEK